MPRPLWLLLIIGGLTCLLASADNSTTDNPSTHISPTDNPSTHNPSKFYVTTDGMNNYCEQKRWRIGDGLVPPGCECEEDEQKNCACKCQGEGKICARKVDVNITGNAGVVSFKTMCMCDEKNYTIYNVTGDAMFHIDLTKFKTCVIATKPNGAGNLNKAVIIFSLLLPLFPIIL